LKFVLWIPDVLVFFIIILVILQKANNHKCLKLPPSKIITR